MNKLFKTSLLTGVSVIALSVMAAAPASAFDLVNWTWDAAVSETVAKTVVVDINLAPTGMVMVEDLQMQIGDVVSSSDVHGIYNNQPQEGGGLVDLGTTDIQFHYGLGGPNDGVVVLDDEFKSPEVVAGTVDEGDQFPDINGTVTATIDLGEVEVPATESYDALTELPSIVSAAVSVANNTSITSDSSVELHEGQFAFNSGEVSPEYFDGIDTGNTNLSLTTVLGILALNGDLGQSKIKATSEVYDILNATVDSSAMAVANNLNVNVEPVSGQDSLVIADVVQFAHADVTAKSNVQDVAFNNYTNLGLLDSPIINSVATAIGNNKSITVVAPAVVVTP